MAFANPPWYLNQDDEETICRCGHLSAQHQPVFSEGEPMTYPCGMDEHFDIDSNGRMVLVEEPCPCENYRQEGED